MYDPNGKMEKLTKTVEGLKKEEDYTAISAIPLKDLVKFANDFVGFGNRLLAKTIFHEGEQLTIPEACIAISTDDLEKDEYCTQTVIDMFEILILINTELL